jgi:hypothetical protein
MIKSHTFRGQRWKIVEAPPDLGGECQAPFIKNREMCIPTLGHKVTELDTIIHESLHACCWDLDEEAVHESARDIARILWRLGWRNDG